MKVYAFGYIFFSISLFQIILEICLELTLVFFTLFNPEETHVNRKKAQLKVLL
jgi:hypothetical protein